MRLKPHNVLETITNPELASAFLRRDLLSSKKNFIALYKTFCSLVNFDFGEIGVSEESKEFGLDLLDKDMFDIPYPNMSLSVKDGDKTSLICLFKDENKNFSVLFCASIIDENGKTIGGIPVAAGHNITAKNKFNTKISFDFQVQTFVEGDQLSNVLKDSSVEDLLTNAYCRAISYVTMLMSRGVIKDFNPEPAKLNKKRAKKGKPLIKKSYTIKLCTDVHKTENKNNGAHASPRPHWRRGHIRTMHRGTEKEFHIPIAPCLVAADGTELIKPRDYEVKG